MTVSAGDCIARRQRIKNTRPKVSYMRDKREHGWNGCFVSRGLNIVIKFHRLEETCTDVISLRISIITCENIHVNVVCGGIYRILYKRREKQPSHSLVD